MARKITIMLPRQALFRSKLLLAVLWFLGNFGSAIPPGPAPHRPSAAGFAPTSASSGDGLRVLPVLVLAGLG